jgi:hypothetical protein
MERITRLVEHADRLFLDSTRYFNRGLNIPLPHHSGWRTISSHDCLPLAKAVREPTYSSFGSFRRRHDMLGLKQSNVEKFEFESVRVIDKDCMGAQALGFG